jgi:predicted methyltransferase
MTIFPNDARGATVYAIALAVSVATCTTTMRIAAAAAAAPSYEQIAADPLRTDQDRRADETRKPAEFLQFAQVKPGMRVLDVAAGAGYTTQLLALAVGREGTVWAQGEGPSQPLQKRLSEHPQSNIVPVTRSFEDPVPEGVSNLDLITIVMNYHDIAYLPVDRSRMDRRLFDALKPGGRLVIIDHSAKDGTGVDAAKTLHRIDEAVVRQELTRAGFRLDAESNFLRVPADPREQAFFDMRTPTDKFALRYVKP